MALLQRSIPDVPTPVDGQAAFVLTVAADLSLSWVAADLATHVALGLAPALPPGLMAPYAAAGAPSGWLLCDGSTVSRTTYAALFAAIGTTWGGGDGSTTFNVPDLRQRFPLGKAASGTGSMLGSTGGAIDHGHSGAAHRHTNSDTSASQVNGSDDTPGTLSGGAGNYTKQSHTHPLSSTGAASAGNTGTANPAYAVVTYIVKT